MGSCTQASCSRRSPPPAATRRLRSCQPEVLTVELKSNLLAPVRSGTVKARGEVLRAGRILTVCQGDAFGVVEGEATHVATMLATMITRDEDLAAPRSADVEEAG
jgi:acyl-coenzyme A thioesterase PaaI-like protein